MSHREPPRFPRGFLLSERPTNRPPTFIEGPILPNFYIHPWNRVETSGDSRLFVIIIGNCVPTEPIQLGSVADSLLARLQDSETEFLRALAIYSGRHVIIFGSYGDIRVVNDATSMRSVFYATSGGVIASHAVLVERALGGCISQSELPFRYGYPGNRTPFRRTKILTPNTYYWMSANVVRRFWPVVPLKTQTTDFAAAKLLKSSAIAMRSVGQERAIGITLTAGLDSRALLAIALNAGLPFHTYTYGDDKGTEIDRVIASRLANQFGIEHVVVDKRVQNPVLEERINESHYALHHAGWIGALRSHFSSVDHVAVIGNLLEIGRSNYSPARNKGAAAPVTARTMSALHHRKLGDELKRRVNRYGPDNYYRESAAAFEGYINDTGFVPGILDPFDQFYWEHRMATWQGVAMGERDFYADTFVPFNSRHLFEIMLGVPSTFRHADAIVKRMIEMVDPALFDLPINPRNVD